MMFATQSFSLSRLSNASGWRNFMAAGVAVGMHALVLALLLAQWPSDTPDAPKVRTLTTQLITLPAPVVPDIITPPEPMIVPPVQPAKPIEPVEAPKPDPRIQQQKLEQAALARMRVEEQERQRELQRAQQREQQRIAEQQALARREAEAQQRLAQEQARQRQAAAAAERARQAEAAAAASRQYLPIAKDAPDYPDRALDKNIEGDCTVSYRVNPQGRVENPRVIGDCHPLFVRPSLSAAKTFRYQPRLENGKAVAVDGVKNTFHYRIE